MNACSDEDPTLANPEKRSETTSFLSKSKLKRVKFQGAGQSKPLTSSTR